MKQTAALMPVSPTAFDKYPATWFPTAFTRDTERSHLIITHSSAYANGGLNFTRRRLCDQERGVSRSGYSSGIWKCPW